MVRRLRRMYQAAGVITPATTGSTADSVLEESVYEKARPSGLAFS